MVATITSALSRLGGLMVTGLMLLILMSFVCKPEFLRQVVQRSLPVPAATSQRAPVVEPDPRADNVVRGVTDQVTIETPVPAFHAGHHH